MPWQRNGGAGGGFTLLRIRSDQAAVDQGLQKPGGACIFRPQGPIENEIAKACAAAFIKGKILSRGLVQYHHCIAGDTDVRVL